MLAAMFSGRHELLKEEDGCVFIDRDGTHFRLEILNVFFCFTVELDYFFIFICFTCKDVFTW